LEKRKVGLALGSGAARGLAHIGVLDVLLKEGIPIDMVAGTSAGAVIGGLYAQGKTVEEITSFALELKGRKLVLLIDPSFLSSGLIKGGRVKSLLSSYFGGDVNFSELKLPFACVTTDIETGEEVVIDHGSVLDAIRASFSIPGIFTVAKWEGRALVDGALVNPIPVDVLVRMGADYIIAVNVLPGASNEIRNAHKENKSTFRDRKIVQEVTSLFQRLSKDKTDNLDHPDIIEEVSSLVQRFAKEGTGQPDARKAHHAGLKNMNQEVSERVQRLAVGQRAPIKEPNMVNVLMQSLNISAYSLVRASVGNADIVIEPHVDYINPGDFLKGKECIEQGRLATQKLIPEIKGLLEIE